jgi:hypothetical protein
MDLTFIDIISNKGHVSSLKIGGRTEKGYIVALGGVEHQESFRPKTEGDRQKLINYLLALDYSEEES